MNWTLSKTTKMPCKSFSLSPNKCNMGAVLRKIKGTICSKCYGCKGFTMYPVVQTALEIRWQAIQDVPQWKADFITIFSKIRDQKYFRWFDNGDVPNLDVLMAIFDIARQFPKTRFWLPTKEVKLILPYLKKCPSNLTIRFSAYFIGQDFSALRVKHNVVTCSSGFNEGFQCPAPKQNGECRACRKCWSNRTKNVNYKIH